MDGKKKPKKRGRKPKNLLIESKYLASYFYNALKCCKMNNQYHNLQAQMMHLNNSLVNY